MGVMLQLQPIIIINRSAITVRFDLSFCLEALLASLRGPAQHNNVWWDRKQLTTRLWCLLCFHSHSLESLTSSRRKLEILPLPESLLLPQPNLLLSLECLYRSSSSYRPVTLFIPPSSHLGLVCICSPKRNHSSEFIIFSSSSSNQPEPWLRTAKPVWRLLGSSNYLKGQWTYHLMKRVHPPTGRMAEWRTRHE